MKKGRVTLPIEQGFEDIVLELIEKWGADAIRNSDGTNLNKYFEELDCKVYSTYFPVRQNQDYPRENPDQKQHMLLMSDRVTATSNELTIDLLASYYKEQLEVSYEGDPYKYWQVFDRTTGNEVKEFIVDKNKNTVTFKTIPFHIYTVNFFAYQSWDITQMYNHLTNLWSGKKSIPYDIVYDKTKDFILKELREWCDKNKNIDVVRFTTFFYHFTVMYDNHIRQKFGDWFGYSASVSPKTFENFKKIKGYELKSEDIVDEGYYNNGFRNPSKIFLDFIDYQNELVCKMAKLCVDIVHKSSKEALMFIGDNWIGIEPYSDRFKKIGLDGVVGSAECGVDIRMVSDMDIKIKEIRFLPYFFPDIFYEGNNPEKEMEFNWMRSRRAILAKKVDRIGFGGYLSLAYKFPKFINIVEKVCDEFRKIHKFTKGEESKKHKTKIAILNSWGKIKSWQCNRTGHASGIKENISYIGVLEILSGLPFNIEFINFEDIKNIDKLNEFGIIINVGQEKTAFSGGKNWLDERVQANIREWVYKGNTFVGIGDPSFYEFSGTSFQLSDILGVSKEIGNTLQYSRYYGEIKDINISTGEDKKYIYNINDNIEILKYDKRWGIEIARNNYGKGYGIYLSGLPYSIENINGFYNLLLSSMNSSDRVIRSDNIYIEAYEFTKNNTIALINNSNIEQQTTILNKKYSLKPYELLFIK